MTSSAFALALVLGPDVVLVLDVDLGWVQCGLSQMSWEVQGFLTVCLETG